MQKSLEQIQIENRKFILEATGEYKDELELLKQQAHQIYHEIISKSFYSKPLTLSRVLLALKNKEVKTCYGDDLIFNIAGSQFCGLSVEDEESYATTYTLYGICLWNLALGEIEITLEEQTEETQRGINEFFNN
jgi:hypothetical protein